MEVYGKTFTCLCPKESTRIFFWRIFWLLCTQFGPVFGTFFKVSGNQIHLKVLKMQKFWEKMLHSLEKHSERGVVGVYRDCKIWIGCRDSEGYGKKRVTWPNGRKTLTRVHRLAYMAHHNSLKLPTVNNFGETLEVSHLCHNKLCVNPDHLILETPNNNMLRIHCRRAGVCTMAHVLPCIF